MPERAYSDSPAARRGRSSIRARPIALRQPPGSRRLDDEHRAVGLVRDAVRDAAEHPPLHPLVPDHQQIGATVGGEAHSSTSDEFAPADPRLALDYRPSARSASRSPATSPTPTARRLRGPHRGHPCSTRRVAMPSSKSVRTPSGVSTSAPLARPPRGTCRSEDPVAEVADVRVLASGARRSGLPKSRQNSRTPSCPDRPARRRPAIPHMNAWNSTPGRALRTRLESPCCIASLSG